MAESLDDARVAELLDEYLAAARAGRAPEREGFVAAHPEVGEALRQALHGLEFIGAPAPEERVLGDFRLVKEIGRGGMGVVYEAEQISLRRPVALKVLPFAGVLDQKQLSRFRHEAQAAALLHHTHIVPVYAVGQERGVHYFAMQLVEGMTLAAVVEEVRGRRGPGSSAAVEALTSGRGTETQGYCRAVAKVGACAAEALEHAHQHGVVHRDIKPGNLMLDAGGHLWVTDFGLARGRSDASLTVTGDLVGTVAYMSPEQAAGHPVDHRTDVYSLGATLYEVLTLHRAFGDGEPHQVLARIATEEPPVPRSWNRAIPAELETILLKAMRKEMEHRYATAQEMADDLRRFLESRPVLAKRPTVLDRAAKWAGRHKNAVRVGTAALLLAAAGLAAGTVHIARERTRTKVALREAEANFEKAVQAVDRMLSRVGQATLADVPHMEPVRRALLEDAVAFYEGFLRERGAGGRVGLEGARAHLRLGDIYVLLGQFEEAEEAFARSEELVESLLRQDPSLAEGHHQLLHVSLGRAGLWRAAGREAEAVAAYQRAVDLGERITSTSPDDREYRSDLSNACHHLATLLHDLGRFAEAEDLLVRSRRRLEALAARLPDDLKLHEGLAAALHTLAQMLRERGRLAEAEAAFRECLRLCDAFGGAAFQDSFLRSLEPMALCHLGGLLQDTGRMADAEAAFREALARATRRVEASPHLPAPRGEAAEARVALAGYLLRTGRGDEAAELHREAITDYEARAADFEAVPSLKLELARCSNLFGNLLVDAGDLPAAEDVYRRTIELDRELAAASPEVPAHRKDLADALSNLGACLMRMDRGEEAARFLRESLEVYDGLLAEAPDFPAYRHGVLLPLSNLGALTKGQEALEHMQRAAGICGLLADEFPEAFSYRERFPLIHFNLGECLREEDRLDEAEAAYLEAARNCDALAAALPGRHEFSGTRMSVHLGLADVELRRERAAEADAHLRRAMELLEREAPRLDGERRTIAFRTFNLGNLLRKAQRFAEAEPSYRRSAALLELSLGDDPSDAEVATFLGHSLANLAKVLEAVQRVPEGEEAWRACIRVRARLAEAVPEESHRREVLSGWESLAAFLERAGKRAEAETARREVVALARRWVSDGAAVHKKELAIALHNLSSILMDTERAEEAEEVISEAVLVGEEAGVERSQLALFHYNRGIFQQFSLGREAEAARSYARALELAPDDWGVLNNLTLLLCTSGHPAVRDLPGAVELARRATRSQPEGGDAWNLLAFTLGRSGQWEESLVASRRSMELRNGGNADDWLLVAEAHARLGDTEEARAWYDRAVAGTDDADESLRTRREEVARLLGLAQR